VRDALSALTSGRTDHFVSFWGFAALAYGGLLCLPRDEDASILSFLWLLGCLWLGYYAFWIAPWPRYLFPAAAMAAFFTGKLCVDLATNFWQLRASLWSSLRLFATHRIALPSRDMAALGSLLALLTLVLLTGYQLQWTLRMNVLDRVAGRDEWTQGPQQFWAVPELVAYLNKNVDRNSVIDTWEREMGTLTDHRYHFPDESLLARADAHYYRGAPCDYTLGIEDLKKVQATYVIVGWLARANDAYDLDALAKHSELVTTIGYGPWRYDIFRLTG
jgi:hypothetical protein